MLASTEQRIEEIVDSPFDKVGSALSLASVLERQPSGVECYVVPVSDRPEGNRHNTGKALQKVNLTIGVVFAIRSLNDRTGERGSQALEAARDAVRDALYGWTPNGASAPYLLGPSDLVKMDKGGIWWIDRYTTSRQRRSKQQ